MTGYWVPYEAAKALLATFCYEIRFVLTPMFGNDFVNTCIPTDNDGFGSFHIDPKIVEYCAEDVKRWAVPVEDRRTTTRSRPSATTTSSKAIRSTNRPLKVIRPRRTRQLEAAFSGDDDVINQRSESIQLPSLSRAEMLLAAASSAVESPSSLGVTTPTLSSPGLMSSALSSPYASPRTTDPATNQEISRRMNVQFLLNLTPKDIEAAETLQSLSQVSNK
jgi:hypothetical protein